MSHPLSTSFDISAAQLTVGDLAYVGQRAKNSHYDYVLRQFRQSGMSRADLARKIRKSPAQLSRLLATPGNWTIETYAELLMGICGHEAVPSSVPFLGRNAGNGLREERLMPADMAPLPNKVSASGGNASPITINLSMAA